MEFDPARLPPEQGDGNQPIVAVPLGGTRAQAIQRLQVGLTGLATMVLLVGLANIVIVSARQNQAEVVPESVAEAPSESEAEPARNPLADAGVVPDMPAEAPADRIEPLDPAILGIRLNRRASAFAALAFLICGGAACAQADAAPPPPALGLMGTLPLYWGEADGLGEMLASDGPQHWARVQIERDYRLIPLDWLDVSALAPLDRLLLAQPRAFSPEENVALDNWVRGGGQLLLFADPMLTGESRFAIGDRRRPQDVVLLSPILAHWGLRMEYAPDQPAGLRHVETDGGMVPVQLAGHLASSGTARDCAIGASGLLAQCRIGAGRVLIVADAALLDLHRPDVAAAPALSRLLAQAFPKTGDDAGNPRRPQKMTVFQHDTPSLRSHPPPKEGAGQQ